jgi:hypothetical protein
VISGTLTPRRINKVGIVPPPVVLTIEQFNDKIENGATSIAEIDPVFAKWYLELSMFGKLGILQKLFNPLFKYRNRK